jgi:hypothetical protein
MEKVRASGSGHTANRAEITGPFPGEYVDRILNARRAEFELTRQLSRLRQTSAQKPQKSADMKPSHITILPSLHLASRASLAACAVHPDEAGQIRYLNRRQIRYHPPIQSLRSASFMTNTTTTLLVPFILAFLVFVFRFYNREGANSMTCPSFLLASLTVVIAFAYLILGIVGVLPPYSTIGFAAAGLILLATAIVRMFMI